MLKCLTCDNRLDYDNIGLCKKFYGRTTTRFHCYDCISKRDNFPKEKLFDIIRYYQNQGCMLFSVPPEKMNK